MCTLKNNYIYFDTRSFRQPSESLLLELLQVLLLLLLEILTVMKNDEKQT